MRKLLSVILLIFLLTSCSSGQKSKEEAIEYINKMGIEHLDWEDFKVFGEGENIGSGMYIQRYELKDNFYLLVGGYGEIYKPISISIINRDDKQKDVVLKDFIKIQDISIEEAKSYVEKNKDKILKYANKKSGLKSDTFLISGKSSEYNLENKENEIFFPYFSNNGEEKMVGYIRIYKSEDKIWYEYDKNSFTNFGSNFIKTNSDDKNYYLNMEYNILKDLYESYKKGELVKIENK